MSSLKLTLCIVIFVIRVNTTIIIKEEEVCLSSSPDIWIQNISLAVVYGWLTPRFADQNLYSELNSYTVLLVLLFSAKLRASSLCRLLSFLLFSVPWLVAITWLRFIILGLYAKLPIRLLPMPSLANSKPAQSKLEGSAIDTISSIIHSDLQLASLLFMLVSSA